MRGQDSNFVVKVMGETKTLFIPGCGFNSAIECDEKPIMQDEKDGLLWFCEKCNNKLYEKYFSLTNIMTQFQETFEYFYGSKELRTCKKCGHEMEPPAIIK